MTLDPKTPVLVGSGQHLCRTDSLDDALSPVQLMAAAARLAATDAGLAALPSHVDSVRVVGLLSWRYRDPARFLAGELGITTDETAITTMGGNSPQSLVNATAAQILAGDLDIAVLAGAEAYRTRIRARRAGAELPWPTVPEEVVPQTVIGHDLHMSHPNETAMGVVMPVNMYPMFESAIRAASGLTPEEHMEKVGGLWARFNAVAVENPFAWSREPLTASQITTAGPSNRMVGLPYTKYMNSNNDVDMGAALIMCSVEKAEALGIGRDHWVFPHAGSDCHEHQYVSERYSLTETPAIALGGRLALELAGVDIDDVEVIDLYSCFPSAVQLGAASLGLSLDRQLTRTGGLGFAGGPWNNYVMHSIATVMNDLRVRQGAYGLVWANGGYATKHAFGVYSTDPPASGFRHARPQAQIDAMARRVPVAADAAAGTHPIESYTVMHGRDGSPETGLVSFLTGDGGRAWGHTADAADAASMCHGEWVGRLVHAAADGTVTLA